MPAVSPGKNTNVKLPDWDAIKKQVAEYKGTQQTEASAGPGSTEVAKVPAAVGEQSPADDIVEKVPDTSVSDVIPAPPNVPAETEPQADMMPAALRRLHKRLDSEVELYKLHIKHYHVTLRQFKLRTSELALPQTIP